MEAVLLLLPLVLIGGAALAAFVCVRRSYLRIASNGVEVRNYPQAPRLVPIAQVERFEAAVRVGNFASFRPATAVLYLPTDRVCRCEASKRRTPATESTHSTRASPNCAALSSVATVDGAA